VTINALGTGARLALRDRADRAAVEGVHPGEAERVVELDAPRVERSRAARTAPAPVRVELPAPRLEFEPTRLSSAPVEVDAGLYTRAVEVARGEEALSGAALRRALGVRHNVAAALIAELEANGVIAATKNALGQRPVLLSA
jgi:DNA segregation ATPase FtsK/SpoIIIE-like protein